MPSGYPIWSEGYAATCEHGTAVFHGVHEGRTFAEACSNCFGDDSLFNYAALTYWGCRLYPDEARARASFG